MRLPKSVLFLVLFSSLLAIPAFAQRGGGAGGHPGGGARGGGHPGGGGYSGGYRGGGYRGYYGGYGRYYGGRYFGPGFYFGFGLGYPYYGYYPYDYGYPYYYGYGQYYYGYDPYAYRDYPTYSAPPVTIQPNNSNPNPPQGQSAPQYPPQTQPQQPQAQRQSTDSQDQNYYLIAFTNHLIEAATAYKVEGDQIHWTTLEGQQKQAQLSTVDVGFSRKVNRDRGVDFQIP